MRTARSRATASRCGRAGARKLITALWNAGLIDEVDLFVQPMVLGEGVPLLLPSRRAPPSRCRAARGMPGDLVELRYSVVRVDHRENARATVAFLGVRSGATPQQRRSGRRLGCPWRVAQYGG